MAYIKFSRCLVKKKHPKVLSTNKNISIYVNISIDTETNYDTICDIKCNNN